MKFKSKIGNIAMSNGMPLVSAEVQAYFDGWEQGRKALIKELKAEIENRSYGVANDSVIQGEIYERRDVLEIIDKHAGGE